MQDLYTRFIVIQINVKVNFEEEDRMKNYVDFLEDKYLEIIKEMSSRESDSLGDVVQKMVKKAKSKGVESNKAEARDAIMVLAAKGILKIKKYEQKRLEIIFKGEGEKE